MDGERVTGRRARAERTRAEVAALVPWLTPRQLEYWVEKGWIFPERETVQGRPRVFSGPEKRVLRAMARLVRAGFPAATAAQVARRAVTLANPGTGTAAVPLAGGDLVIVITGV